MTSQIVNESFSVVRAPLDPATGAPFESCQYALFPGITLAQSEPELVVLLYDSLLHQYPDTAMFLYKGYGADPLLNRKYQQRLLTRWRILGKPKVIIATPEDRKFFRGSLGEVPTASLYDILIERGVSGGCNRELYRLSEPADYGFEDALRELADMMGVTLYETNGVALNDAGNTSSGAIAGTSGGTPDIASLIGDAPSQTSARATAPAVKPADVSRIPFLTSSMEVRNAMKKNGFEAVHILELIFGMGRSNRHLAHVHAEGHDHAGAHNHGTPPQVRDTVMNDEERTAQAALFDDSAKKQNLQELHDTLLAFFWSE